MSNDITIFRMNTKIITGFDSVSNIAEYVHELKGNRIMVVTDPGIVKSGALDKLKKALEQANLFYIVYDNVVPNPPIPLVEQGAEIAKKESIDLFIAVGGGSPMDVAKGINVLITNGGKVRDFVGQEKVKTPTFPLIAIPTTCGTGSEVTRSACITDLETQEKLVIISSYVIPQVALIDPTLLQSLPPRVIASTGMDALTHALEAYVSAKAQPLSDALAIYAIELIADNLRKAVHYQKNLENIQNVTIASTMAGIAFTNGFLGLVHAMAHPLGGVFDIPHGVANAILLPYVMKFNLVANYEKFAKIAKVMGENVEGLTAAQAAEKSLTAVLKLSADVGIPANLKAVGADMSKLDKLVADSLVSGNIYTNPRKNTPEDIRNIFLEAYEGTLTK